MVLHIFLLIFYYFYHIIGYDAIFMFEIGQDREIAALRTSKCVRLFCEVIMDEYFMRIALNEAKRAYKKDDVPVGAVVVKNGKIISKGYNTKNIKNCAINHAEINVISKACRKLHTWHLEDCTLYVTMEPCLMCCGAIIQARMGKVVYGTKCSKFGYAESLGEVLNSKKNNHVVDVVSGVLDSECSFILKDFFSKKRG